MVVQGGPGPLVPQHTVSIQYKTKTTACTLLCTGCSATMSQSAVVQWAPWQASAWVPLKCKQPLSAQAPLARPPYLEKLRSDHPGHSAGVVQRRILHFKHCRGDATNSAGSCWLAQACLDG